MNILVNCPFHPSRIGREDTHPSCNCDPEQDVFFCHGCGATGKLSRYPELVMLVEQAGRGSPAPTPTLGITVPTLAGLPREFLISRGFSEEVLKLFEIGGNEDRVWIPVKLRSGEYAGFIFRHLFSDQRFTFSYGFKKHLHLFGTYQFIRYQHGQVFVVEGPLDCAKMHQLGFRNTVAIMGSNASSQQLDLLRQLGHTICLALDRDPAGVEATTKLGRLLLQRGHTVDVLEYDAEDPGELISGESLDIKPFLSSFLQVLKNNGNTIRIK